MMRPGMLGGLIAAAALAGAAAYEEPMGGSPRPGDARMAIDGFEGPKFDGEEVLCTGCWDASDNNPEADNDIPAGEPAYYRLANIEHDEWDAYCAKCARAYASQQF